MDGIATRLAAVFNPQDIRLEASNDPGLMVPLRTELEPVSGEVHADVKGHV